MGITIANLPSLTSPDQVNFLFTCPSVFGQGQNEGFAGLLELGVDLQVFFKAINRLKSARLQFLKSEFFARQSFVGLYVFFARLFDDVVGQFHARA